MSIKERDDALCSKIGWPTIIEQQAYWEQHQKEINENIFELLDSMARTMRNITEAVSGLQSICAHQQSAIEQMNNERKT